MAMSAPRWANLRAIAAPMPRLEPVTGVFCKYFWLAWSGGGLYLLQLCRLGLGL